MSVVSLLNVNVLNNPARFADKYQFEITFECLEPLTKDLEWKLTYVGSANSTEHDQELDSLLVGPIPVGVNKFVFEAEPPTLAKLPSSEILGVTVVLLTCSYDGREFVRVGYYVSNEYDSEELNNEPPKQVQTDRIVRNVLAEKPRVTRFAIKWDSEESAPSEFPPDQPEVDEAEDDAENYGAEEEEELEGEEEAGAAPADEDVEMGGADDTAGPAAGKEADEVSDDGSEDLEAESSGEDDEEEEEGEGEAEEDDAMVDDSAAAKSGEASSSAQPTAAQPVVPK
ncbi:histone deposition protein Asf1 [Choiromyces venosus 120613-1]|uniref:Histone chaperone n=1 Tax=Choiromyces venosus 120613-1 TaxID=1336337 RepID=A0A3N4JLT2_9PEZI|nr:histone deposition protein Asf1 [Choiromyces venosus 120613-1]